MHSVLKPRFKHLLNAAEEMNSQDKISIESDASKADGWGGDSESIYEMIEEHLNTSQDQVAEIKNLDEKIQ